MLLKQKFELMASSKANYYTKGSPIQFVKLDLLKEVSTGEVAVCFSFKNVSEEPLQNLNIRFKCKDMEGEVVCDTSFCYEGIIANANKVFGSDEAVYLSEAPLSSIDVRLLSAKNVEGEDVPLMEYQRVRLPQQTELAPEICEALQKNTKNSRLKYEPNMMEEGWQCSCGAFHAGTEESVYCDQCGADRILVQNMITSLKKNNLGQASLPEVDEQPTRTVYGKSVTYNSISSDQEATQIVSAVKDLNQEQDTDEIKVQEKRQYRRWDDDYDEEDDTDEESFEDDIQEREEHAKMLIKWVPVVTGLMCLLVIAGGAMWYQLFIK